MIGFVLIDIHKIFLLFYVKPTISISRVPNGGMVTMFLPKDKHIPVIPNIFG